MIQGDVAHGETVPVQVARLSPKPSRLRQGRHRNRAMGSGHPADSLPGGQDGPGRPAGLLAMRRRPRPGRRR